MSNILIQQSSYLAYAARFYNGRSVSCHYTWSRFDVVLVLVVHDCESLEELKTLFRDCFDFVTDRKDSNRPQNLFERASELKLSDDDDEEGEDDGRDRGLPEVLR